MTPEVAARALRDIEAVPVGDVAPDVIDAIVRRLSRRVGVSCRQRPGLPADTLPRLGHRPQVSADEALALLDDLAVTRGATVVGITTEDLGHPLFTFFFGRARVGGSAVVSLHRLDPVYYGLPADADLVLRRAVLECVHELGHVAGLRHCRDYRCVMHFSGDVESLDLRGQSFCDSCTSPLTGVLRHALLG